MTHGGIVTSPCCQNCISYDLISTFPPNEEDSLEDSFQIQKNEIGNIGKYTSPRVIPHLSNFPLDQSGLVDKMYSFPPVLFH